MFGCRVTLGAARRGAAMSLALAASLLLGLATARADEPAEPKGAPEAKALAEAKALFKAGVAAYTSGEFEAALQAFRQSYAITPRPGLIFSMAQTQRRLFYAGGRDPQHLQAAIQGYTAYLEAVKRGGRRLEASQAIEELERVRRQLGLDRAGEGPGDAPEPTPTDGATVGEIPEPTPEPAPTAPEPEATRLMVTSPARGATVALDG
ncbi:MAG: hypothetical protein KC731_42115, partial [Myxococcales bacterium]|nr:hypothetical protein [Myxococcales bacterium]